MSGITDIFPTPSVNLSSSFGAILLGVFASFALWGATCLQTFIYFMNYPMDRWWFKAGVFFLWLLNTAHEGLLIAGVWPPLISHYADFTLLEHFPNPPLCYQVLLTGIAVFVGQTFFVWRVYVFSQRKFVWPLILMPFTFASLALSAFNTWAILPASAEIVPAQTSMTIGYVNSGLVVGVDICVSIAMIMMLRENRTGVARTDKTIFRLVVLMFASGGWSAVLAFVILVTLIRLPEGAIYFAFELPACALYCNTVLANLNTRNYVRSPPRARRRNHNEIELTPVVFRSKPVGSAREEVADISSSSSAMVTSGSSGMDSEMRWATSSRGY